jgi:glycosyltransferase involved in cell wall biosynthesis
MMRVKQRNAPQVDRALGVSHHVTTAHTEHGFFDESQSATISNIVKKSYCRLPGSFQSPLTFGFLGHIGPTKGLHILLEAYSRLSHPGVGPLLVAGSANPQYKAALQERHRDTRIEWRGYVDPAAFLLEIDILVVPSVWQEPQGRVALEALRHGVPVIASAVGGLRDMAAYTEGVRLIPSGDAVALYQTMAELIARPFRVREMSRAAPDIDALCSPQAVMDGLADAVDGPAQADAARTAPSASAAWAAASRSKHGGTSP